MLREKKIIYTVHKVTLVVSNMSDQKLEVFFLCQQESSLHLDN